MATDVTIPKPLTSGTADFPNVLQPEKSLNNTPDDLPAGYARTGSAAPDDLPSGYSRTAPPIASPPGTPSLASAPGAPGKMPAQKGAFEPVPGSVLDLPSNAYSSPLQTLIGAAKGVIPTIQAGLPQTGQLPYQASLTGRGGLRMAPAPPTPPPNMLERMMAPSNPAQESGATLPGLIGMAAGAYQTGRGLLGKPTTLPPGQPTAPENPVAQGRYSEHGNNFSGVMRSNSHFDMPAEATRAIPAMQEAAADLGVNTSKDFKGMNGPTLTKRIVGHAIDINEARNVQAIDPVRSQPAEVLKTSELEDLIGKKNPTIDDVDKFRIDANKKLAKSGYYGQSPSQQYAAGPDVAKLEAAASQARDVVYDSVYKHTGVDIRPSKQIESSLIKMNDVANSTNNTLAQQEAKYQSTPMKERILGSVKRLVSIKANPTNAFEAGISSPTDEFNSNMQKVFGNVKPTPGSVIKNGRLVQQTKGVLTPPSGQTPPEPNRQLPLTLEPGEHGFNLTPPAGQTPPALADQYGLPGISRSPRGADLHVPPQPELPRPLNPARSLGAAAATEVPGALREQIPDLNRRTTNRALMTPQELEEGIKGRKPVRTPFDVTEGASATINRDKNMPAFPSHAGGGAASVEELARPGQNYVVPKAGPPTFHGKSFDPGATPSGAAHVTVLPSGELRVNEGKLTPAMEHSLRAALKAK